MKKKLVLLLATLMCISLCACGGSETSSGNNTDTKTEENGGSLSQGEGREVEITMDNWQEYFEEKDIVSARYNAFDEIEDVIIHQVLAVKEGITIDPYKSNVAIEYNGHTEMYYVKVDTDTWQVTFEERKDEHVHNVSQVEEFGIKTYKQGDSEKTEFALELCGRVDHWLTTDTKTQRTFIDKYFIDEITRVKGTLYIIEE